MPRRKVDGEESPLSPGSIVDRLRKKLQTINNEYAKQQKTELTRPRVALASDLPDPEVISTGNPALDFALGGGIPEGTIFEFYGQPGSGKTFAMAYIAAEVQKRGKVVVYYNTEEPNAPKHAWEVAGVDPDGVIYIEARRYAEDGLNILRKVLFDDSGNPVPDIGMVVIDSVASLAPAAEVKSVEDKGEEGSTVATLARLVSKFLRGVAGGGWLSEGCIVGLVNQERADIAPVPKPNISTGGNAIRFYPKIRINFKSGSNADLIYDENKNVIGNTVRFTVTKNNTGRGRPYASGSWTYRYGVGLDVTTPVINEAMEYGLIMVSGRTYTIRYLSDSGPAEHRVVGRNNLDTFMNETMVKTLFGEMPLLNAVMDLNSRIAQLVASKEIAIMDGVAIKDGEPVDIVAEVQHLMGKEDIEVEQS